MERVKYDGLRIEDFDILASAKRNGFHVQWLDSVGGVVHINEALAQITEMERDENYMSHADIFLEEYEENKKSTETNASPTPLTWNERIKNGSDSDIARAFIAFTKYCHEVESFEECIGTCEECAIRWMHSPYTEGATK